METCHVCSNAISQDFIQAEDIILHLECFVCQECKSPLDEYFMDEEKRLNCKECFMNRFAPSCQVCHDKIMDHVINLQGKTFHENCLYCQDCKTGLIKSACLFTDDTLLCKQCHVSRQLAKLAEDQGPKCGQCLKPITLEEPCVMIGTTRFHLHHKLTCFQCQQILNGPAVEKEGRHHCLSCANSHTNAICFACSKPIESKAIAFRDKALHPECFVCYKCQSVLNKDHAILEGDVVYCSGCDPQTFTKHCPRCFLETPKGKVQHALDRIWCEGCWLCFNCDAPLNRFVQLDGQPICPNCWDNLPRSTKKAIRV